MKILLVEDHAETRRSLRRLIERRGHEVVACASVEKAEAELAKADFPFLILDWMLPGKSGIDFCRELRAGARGDEMFILLITGRAEAEDLQLALEAGANDYLTKPFDGARMNVRLSVAERQIKDLQERNQARLALQDAALRLTDILENTSDGFFSVDPDWKITYLNAEAESAFGLRRERLLGQDFWKEFPHLLGSELEKKYRAVMSERRAERSEFPSEDGRSWYEIYAYPSGGGVSVFFRDITERKRIDAERLTTSKLESLGTLAGGIAHDLNNILTVISGNIGLAQLDAPAHCGTLLTFLAKAGQAAQQAASLSRQLLTFSKGGAPLKKVVSIAELLQRAVEFSLYGSHLRAQVEIEDHLGKAEVDAAQIEQVINALLINAREATSTGGSVAVTAENFRVGEENSLPLTPGRYLRISVADNGSGIPADVAPRIFDPYFTTKPAGSGLGLAISYSIIKKHGGFLHLEKSSPSGATFTFYLPATRGKIAHEPRVPNEPQTHAPLQRMLVMDDEAAIRELTAQLLGTMGYEVVTVADGAEAVRVYERGLREQEKFAAVILDATVRGGLGGVETIARLRQLDPDVRAIICSGYSDAAAMSEFAAYGFCGALPKPFTRRELATALERLNLGRELEPQTR